MGTEREMRRETERGMGRRGGEQNGGMDCYKDMGGRY